ncbi:MAG: hypothetical protein Q4B88_00320 [Moraxella sp.]|nr:hypothetical protein [Moraxella sp.]
MMKKSSCRFFMLLGVTMLLLACGQSPSSDSNTVSLDKKDTKTDKTTLDFSGCYSVDKSLPAQIFINQSQSGYTMQMKEPDGTWDKPEPLLNKTVDEAWQFFSTNAISLDRKDVKAVLVRADEVMALASIDKAVTAVNPHMDSSYVVSLFGAVNTIYQVACDDTPLVLASPHDGVHDSQ